MSVRTAPLSTCTILSLTFAALLTANLFAQQPKVLAPHKPIAPTVTPLPNWHFREPTQRSMVGGFWMIDANFKSTLYIKNGVKNAGIKVTPIAYLSNGKSYTFGEVSLDPSGTLSSVSMTNWESKALRPGRLCLATWRYGITTHGTLSASPFKMSMSLTA